jgi:uncharacterized protein (TIGR02001 family)
LPGEPRLAVDNLARAILGAGVVAGIFLAAPAQAQVAGSIDVESDYVLRGYSLSGGRPTAAARIGYDDDSGAYINALIVGEWASNQPHLLGVQGNVGYAKRLTSSLTVDGGLLYADYRPRYLGGRGRDYVEGYAGLSLRAISARVYLSPDYYDTGAATLYAEVQGTIEPIRNWRLSAHVGALTYLNAPVPYPYKATHADWRLSVARQFGVVELHAALSGGAARRQFYWRNNRDGGASVTAGASWSF